MPCMVGLSDNRESTNQDIQFWQSFCLDFASFATWKNVLEGYSGVRQNVELCITFQLSPEILILCQWNLALLFGIKKKGVN